MRTNALGFRAITVKYMDVNEKKEKEVTAESISLLKNGFVNPMISLNDENGSILGWQHNVSLDEPIIVTKITRPKSQTSSSLIIDGKYNVTINEVGYKDSYRAKKLTKICLAHGAQVTAINPRNVAFCLKNSSKTAKLTIKGNTKSYTLDKNFNENNLEILPMKKLTKRR